MADLGSSVNDADLYKYEFDQMGEWPDAECGWFEMVKDLHYQMGLPVSESINPMLPKRRKEFSKFMIEEVVEFVAAEHLVNQVDKLIDLIVFTLGALVEMGVDPTGIFDVVHDSNMGKIWPDGRPRYSDYGKLLKPPTWEPAEPEISRILSRRIEKESQEIDDDIPF